MRLRNGREQDQGATLCVCGGAPMVGVAIGCGLGMRGISRALCVGSPVLE